MNLIWRAAIGVTLACACLAGCSPRSARTSSEGGTRLTVAAAANLQFAMDDLLAEFHKSHADISVRVTFGSSGSIFAQLMNGAPFDVFLSADREHPEKLVDANLADGKSLRIYAIGELAIWVPNRELGDEETLGMHSLLADSIQRIAMANPQHAPYGRATVEALRHFRMYDVVQSKLVYGDNIAQAAHFLEVGAADIGFLALSQVMAPPFQGRGRYWQLPAESHSPIEQVCVVMKRCENRTSGEHFVAFLLSEAGQGILRRYGYQSPGE